MYTPAAFRETDPAWIAAFVARHDFGMLVTTEPFMASHLPFHFDAARGVLVTHLARPNPQAEAFRAGPAPALAIFRGSHAYVSTAWYGALPAVPTWNYEAVHAEGMGRLTEDRAVITRQMRALAAAYEPEAGFDMDQQPPDFMDRMLKGVVGLEITVGTWHAKRKQSQNRPPADRARVAAALEARGEHEAAAALREANGLG